MLVRGTSPTFLSYNDGCYALLTNQIVIMGFTEKELESEDSGNLIKYEIKSKGIEIAVKLSRHCKRSDSITVRRDSQNQI